MLYKMPGKMALVLLGSLALILGITLVLIWWPAVVWLFKGVVGMALALTGMILLYLAQQ